MVIHLAEGLKFPKDTKDGSSLFRRVFHKVATILELLACWSPLSCRASGST